MLLGSYFKHKEHQGCTKDTKPSYTLLCVEILVNSFVSFVVKFLF